MPVAAKHTKILVDEFDFSGSTNAAGMSSTVAALDTTAFQDDAMTQIAGLPGGMLTQNGYYTGPDAGDIEAELYARQAADNDVYVAILFGTNVADCPAYIAPTSFGQNFKLNSPAAEVITLSAEWAAAAGLRRGIRLHEGELTATGEQASVDMGAAGTDGGTLFLFVQAIDGTGVTVDIEDSSDDVTFAQVGQKDVDAVGVYVLDNAGAIDRYARINLTDLGTATAVTFTAIWTVAGVTE